jgi:lipopolysaccharide export system ATP-binding protein
MKHRLPKAKSSTSRIENQPGMEQTEMLIEEKMLETPPDSVPARRGPPPLPVTVLPATPVHETHATDPNDAGLTALSQSSANAPEEPSSIGGDSNGFLVDTPPAEIKPRPATPPPLPGKTFRATPPPLPARRPPPLPQPTEIRPDLDRATPPANEENPTVAPTAEEDGENPRALTEAAQLAASEPSDVYDRERVASGPPPLLSPRPMLVDDIPLDHAPLLIRTQGLVKQYGGRRVVNGVDIHVSAGEVVGLLGKNGAGKTTTFYMIVGLVAPTQGHVFMGDEDVTRMPMYRRARRGIGYLPQEESIFRKLTVEENLLAILETLPMTEDEREIRCDELLKDFGLEHVRENLAITLSGGEKRRVTIARALVASPTLLLLDEPFSGVDPMAVHDIQEIILHLKERGLGVLITDHNVRETLSVVDRAYIIDEGRVLSEGSREFLLNDPVAREIYLGHRFSM